MRLNVGCGPYRAEGWHNLDLGPTTATDAIASLAHLPFPDGSAEHVYLGHVLEHVAWEDVPVALREVRRVLRPGGEALVVGPDVRRGVEGGMPWAELVTIVEWDVPFDYNLDMAAGRHHWNCTAERVATALAAANFSDVVELPVERVSGDWPLVSRVWWQCAVRAQAPYMGSDIDVVGR